MVGLQFGGKWTEGTGAEDGGQQCFGTWAGTVCGDDGVATRLDGVEGFAEEARNRW
jgi:hypothetical protein